MENVIEFEVGNGNGLVYVVYYENGVEVTFFDVLFFFERIYNFIEIKFWIMNGEYEGVWLSFVIFSRYIITGCFLI